MRLPAALKWLVLGTLAWLAWRVPIVAHDLALLGLKPATPVAAVTSRLVPISTENNEPLVPRNKTATLLASLQHPRMDNAVIVPLPPPPVAVSLTAPEAEAMTAPLHPSSSLGGMLADQGYARLRAGDRKAAEALLARALAAAPGDPRASGWAADRRILTRQWSRDGYVLVRRGDAPALLGTTPTLGGSQTGGRLAYNFNPLSDQRVTLSGRVYQPLVRHSGGARAAQAVAGLELQPSRNVPVSIAVDRYVALGEKARNAWALRLSGGADAIPVTSLISVSFYGQAGMIGIHSHDAYADGWARLHMLAKDSDRLRIRAGAGIWGGTQPGASRLDAGPSIEVGGMIGRASLKGTLDYRLRVGGNASPGNGPALTVQAGF